MAVTSMLLAVDVAFLDTRAQALEEEEGGGGGSHESSETGDAGEGGDESSTVVVARGVHEDPFDTFRAVEVLDQQALTERRPRTVPEALMEVPGAYVQKTNHAGGSPIIRGMIGPQNLILIDGVRLNNSTYRTGPIQYLNTVDSFSLERIELMRGPGSVLYGSDAVGGVIELVTRDPLPPEGEEEARFVPLGIVRGESCDLERSGRAAVSFATRQFGMTGGATLRVYDDLRAGGGVGQQEWSGYNEVDWDIKLRAGEPGSHHIEILYQSVRLRDAGRADKLETSNVLTVYDENYRDLVSASGLVRLDPIATRITITPSWQRQLESRRNIRFSDLEQGQVERVTGARDVTHTLGGSVRFDTRLFARRLDLVYGLEYFHDTVQSETREGSDEDHLDPTLATYPPGSRYDTAGLYVLATATPVRTRNWIELVVHGGARLATFSAMAPDIVDIGDVRFHYTGGVAAAGIHLRQRGRFNVGIGWDQGFRAPNLNQAAYVGDTGEFFHIPNSELGPERADMFEVRGRFLAGPVSLSAAGYLSFLRDFIVRELTTYQGQDVFLDKPVAHNVNAGSGRVVGVEGKMDVALPIFMVIGGDVTWTRGAYEDLDLGWVPMSRIPPIFGSVRLRFEPRWQGVFVEVYAQMAANQDRLSPRDEGDNRIPDGGTPSWWTVNFRAGVRPTRLLHLSVGLSNLADNLYKVHGSGVYAPGFTAWLALEISEG